MTCPWSHCKILTTRMQVHQLLAKRILVITHFLWLGLHNLLKNY